MAETIVLDPTAVAAGRSQLDITTYIHADGLDWGDAEFTAVLAESSRGDLVIGGRLPNRTITIPLSLRSLGATTFTTIRAYLQQKVGLFQREGGWVSRQTPAGVLYADVVNAKLHLGGSVYQAYRDFDIDVVLTLECVPDWYGAEVDLGDNVEITNPELIFTDTGIAGNYPGRVRLVIDNDQANAPQRSVLWGFRARNYSAASTAALAYASSALTALDAATVTGGVVKHTSLATQWTPVMGTNVGGATWLTHVGAYRVWANIGSTLNGSNVSTRFVWDVGDMSIPVENSALQLPGISGYYLMDLGEVYLRQVPVGTHRWQGILQCKGVSGGEAVEVKRLWFQPLDESAGRLIAPPISVEGISTYVARDTFKSTGGLNGKTLDAPAATTWATTTQGTGGSGTDFQENVGFLSRVSASDAAGNLSNGRLASTGSTTQAGTYVTCQVGYDYQSGSKSGFGALLGVIARYQNANYGLFGYWAPSLRYLFVTRRVAGVETMMGSVVLGSADPGINSTGSQPPTKATIGLMVTTDGKWSLLWTPTLSTPQAVLSGYDASLNTAAGGASLGLGKVGIFDTSPGAGVYGRYYTNFQASTPPVDAVIFDSQSMELRSDGAYRRDATGAAYSPVASVLGDLPRVPPSGMEARTVQTFIKASRSDLTDVDSGTDDISARLFYRPSYLYVAGTA